MTQPIDVAYIDIVVRDKSLKQTQRDIDKAMAKVEKDIQADLDKIDADFDDAMRKIDDHFKGMEQDAERSFEAITEAVEDAFNDVDVHVDRHDKRLRRKFTAIGAHIKDTFEDVGDKVSRGLEVAFRKIGDVASNLGTALGQLGSGIFGIVSSSPLLVLIGLLGPAVIALAAALSQLIGLVGVLPAGLGVLVAAIVPVVIAFQNFGDAVSALASGDIDKINEALKKLSPSAAKVAREIAGLLPLLKSFQKSVQEAFFAQVGGSFTKLVTTLLPGISQNVNKVAAAMGQLVKQFVTFATSTNFMNALNDTLDTTANIIGKIGPPLFRFLDAITVSVSAALPFVDRLADAFGRALDKFSGFLNKSIETGAFDTFIENAFTTVKELLGLVKALGGLLGTIFAGTVQSGHDFINTLTALITRMDEFFKSAEGQDVLHDLVTIVKILGGLLNSTVNSFIFLDQQFRVSLAVLEKVGRAFFKLVEIIGDFFGKIPAKIEQLGTFLSGIPAKIGQAISLAFDTAFRIIGEQIGLTLFAIQVLPGKIVDFFSSLPQRIGAALSSTGPTVLDIFKNALDTAQVFISTKFEEVLAFIHSVPDRIVALGPVFLQAGRNLITSFMNGFRSVGSFIGDIAGDIVGSVKSFLNRAIDKINSGIAAIDNILPGNLARIPRLAGGAVVGHRPGGILANIGEGSEDEVVSPLSTLEEIIRKALGGSEGGMNVTFGPGSINVNFAGALPTESEARTVGQAVADGIIGRLAKRNVRTQLRAV